MTGYAFGLLWCCACIQKLTLTFVPFTIRSLFPHISPHFPTPQAFRADACAVALSYVRPSKVLQSFTLSPPPLPLGWEQHDISIRCWPSNRLIHASLAPQRHSLGMGYLNVSGAAVGFKCHHSLQVQYDSQRNQPLRARTLIGCYSIWTNV